MDISKQQVVLDKMPRPNVNVNVIVCLKREQTESLTGTALMLFDHYLSIFVISLYLIINYDFT